MIDFFIEMRRVLRRSVLDFTKVDNSSITFRSPPLGATDAAMLIRMVCPQSQVLQMEEALGLRGATRMSKYAPKANGLTNVDYTMDTFAGLLLEYGEQIQMLGPLSYFNRPKVRLDVADGTLTFQNQMMGRINLAERGFDFATKTIPLEHAQAILPNTTKGDRLQVLWLICFGLEAQDIWNIFAPAECFKKDSLYTVIP